MKTIQLTLAEAIKQAVQFFVDNDGEFSKFAITSIIRSDVNNRKYNLSDVDGTALWHTQVREEFQYLLDRDELPVEFDRDEHDVFQKTTYQVYAPNTNFVKVVIPPKNDSPKPIDTNPFSKLQTNPTKIYSSDSSTTDNLLRIRNYITKRGSATLKNIQSCLKQKGVTCKDILKDLKSQSDLVITPSDNISEYKVTLNS